MIFHDYTLQADGSIRSHRQTEAGKLEPAAVQLFRDLIAHGDYFGPVHPRFPDIYLRWTVASFGALATFTTADQLLTTSGLSRDADSQIWHDLGKILQPTIERFGAATPMPNLYLEAPAIVSIPWPGGSRENIMLAADMETCLAAAYFS